MYNCSNNKKYYDKCEFHDIIYKDSYKYFYINKNAG